MPDIRYVCLSDMHFGADNSLMTNLNPGTFQVDPSAPSPVLKGLAECLGTLISKNRAGVKPTLILNGDIFELALTTDNEAIMAFERFIELTMPAGGELFEEIRYIPGNHDHHLWETARELQYVDNYLARTRPGDKLDIPWHATKMFAPDPVTACLPTGVIKRYPHLQNRIINTAYPNFSLLSADGAKAIIFSHGHFIESMYLLMSTLRTMIFPNREKPRFVWDVEAENFAWIDFFWSTMGRSGDIGRDIELIYDKLQSKGQRKQLIANLAKGLAKLSHRPEWEDWAEAKLIEWVLDFLVGRMAGLERHIPEHLLSRDAENGLLWYIQGPLREQILAERNGNIPSDITFVFGHTHKPFQKEMRFDGYRNPVKVYNSGGWVVDTEKAQPLHGGAVILIDEDFHTISLRMYNEAAEPSGYSVKVERASEIDLESDPFFNRMAELVDPYNAPWKTFSDTAAPSVRILAQNLSTEIHNKD